MASLNSLKGLVWFDCDGVLTDIGSSWGFLHEYFGSKDNRVFMEMYRDGLISYIDWMKIDVALITAARGGLVSRFEVEEAFSKVRVRSEAVRVVRELRKLGLETGVASSGVGLLVDRVCKEIGIDVCLYNDLLFINGFLIPGGVARVPLKNKADVIQEHSAKRGFDLRNVVYVGDSEWDIEVFQKVGLAIAIEPCERACREAHYVVKSLDEIIPLVKKFYGL